MNPRAIEVKYKKPYTLIITFSNQEVKGFDLMPYLDYPIYENLKDEGYCRKARVQDGIVVWGEDIDFDPDTIYLESRDLISIS